MIHVHAIHFQSLFFFHFRQRHVACNESREREASKVSKLPESLTLLAEQIRSYLDSTLVDLLYVKSFFFDSFWILRSMETWYYIWLIFPSALKMKYCHNVQLILTQKNSLLLKPDIISSYVCVWIGNSILFSDLPTAFYVHYENKLRERSLMTSLVFLAIFDLPTYLPTFFYSITSLLGAILDPLPTLILDVINERSLF